MGLAAAGAVTGDNGKAGSARGGGLAVAAGTCTLINTIIATNSAGKGGYGTFVDAGGNVSADGSIAFTVRQKRSEQGSEAKLTRKQWRLHPDNGPVDQQPRN
jgi:hypothetical protein